MLILVDVYLQTTFVKVHSFYTMGKLPFHKGNVAYSILYNVHVSK